MRTRHLIQWSAALGVAGLIAASALPASAAPVPSGAALLKSAAASDVVDVRWRGRRGAGVAAGLATGLLLGGIIASQPYYYDGPGYYYGPPVYYGPPIYAAPYPPDWEAYCFSRYRSFDPISGTYLGYDGRRHYCQ